MNNKFDQELAKFDPQVAELQKIAEDAHKVTITDFSDRDQVALVREKRIELKGLRVNITKTGKALRDDANKFNQAVLEKEKEMVGVIHPEEKRLAELEEEAAHRAEVEKRKKDLPLRKQRLVDIGDEIEIEDTGILEMNDSEFDNYINQRVANWNLKEKERLEAERKAEEERKEREAEEARKRNEEEEAKRKEHEEKVKAEREKLEEDKRKFEEEKRLEEERKKAAEQARKEAEEEAERKEKQRVEAEKQAKAEEERKAKEEEEKKKAEAEALKKREEYQKFLKDNGYTEETKDDFYLAEDSEKVVLYKKVNTFKK